MTTITPHRNTPPQLPVPGAPILSKYPTPNLLDRIYVVRYDARLPEHRTPPKPGSKFVGPEPERLKDFLFATSVPADQVGWQDYYYLNERLNQAAYNYTVDYPYPDPAFPRLIRTYVYLRSDYAKMPTPDEEEMDSVFVTLTLVDYKQLRFESDAILDSLFIGIQKVYEIRPMTIAESEIGHIAEGFGGEMAHTKTYDAPGQEIETGINVVDSKTDKKSINTEVLETVKLKGEDSAGVEVEDGGSGYTSVPTVSFSGGSGSGAAGTALLGFGVKEVVVSAPGSNYASPPAVGFTGDGYGATAVAKLARGVTAVEVTHKGSGYSSVPAVTFSGGGGAGAAATAVVGYPLKKKTFIITNAGSGYDADDPPIVNVGGDGHGAVVVAEIGSAGTVLKLKLSEAGAGYTYAPPLSFESDAGTGATATVQLSPNKGKVKRVEVTAAGTGYNHRPQVHIAGNATGESRLGLNGKVQEVEVTEAGAGYTTPPTITFEGGGGSGAIAVATLKSTGSVDSVILSAAGSYTVAPNVIFTGGGGSGAEATYEIILSRWPIFYESHTDPQYGIVVDIVKKIVPAGTIYAPGRNAPPAKFVDINSLDKWRSIQITSRVDLHTLPKPIVSGRTRSISLPGQLLAVGVVWSVGNSQSASTGTGDTLSASVEAGAHVTGEIVVQIRDGFDGPVPSETIESFFFGPPKIQDIMAPTIYRTSSGTAVVKGSSAQAGSSEGDTGASSSLSQSSRCGGQNIRGVLTGGYILYDDTMSSASAFVTATSGSFSKSVMIGAFGSLSVDIPPSDPLTFESGQRILTESRISRWRFGVFTLEQTFGVVP